jgi:hypothetical protein
LSGTVADIDESPDAPDGAWLTTTGQNQTNSVRVTFGTPTGNPSVGAGLQTFRAFIRLSATNNQHGTATWSMFLWENGSVLNGGTAIASGANTLAVGELVTGTWDASLLSNADGSGVECRIVLAPEGGGSPSSRGAGEVGAVEWVADVVEDASVVETSGSPDAVSLTGQVPTATADMAETTGSPDALTLTGLASTIAADVLLTTGSPDVVTLSGLVATATTDGLLTTGSVDSLVLTGLVPTVDVTSSVSVVETAGSPDAVALTGLAAVATVDVLLTTGNPDALTLTGSGSVCSSR